MPPRLTVLLAIALLVASCALGAPVETTDPAPTTTSGDVTTTTPADTATTATTIPESPEAAATRAEVEALIPVAEQLRGLEFLAPPSITIVTPEGLEARVRDLLQEELDPKEVARDEAVFRLLGILAPGRSLERLYHDLYGEQVGGFYDSETKELVVPVSPDGLLVRERTVIVHELVHALADQQFDFGARTEALIDAEAYDEYSAFKAVIEGDAVRVETAFIQTLTAADLARLVTEYAELDSTVFDGTPHFLQRQLLFPYLQGHEFLRRVEASGGSIDDLYLAPPVSTEQVLHHDRFAAGELPVPVAITTSVPVGYEVGEESTWGQAALESLLGAVLPAADLRAAVEGWGGDSYRIMSDGTNVIWQYHYVGDAPSDVLELATGFRTYLTARAAANSNWTVRSDGTTLVVLVADEGDAFLQVAVDLEAFTPVGG